MFSKIFTLGAVLGPEIASYVWTEGYKTEKKSPFSKISGYLWMGSESVFFFFRCAFCQVDDIFTEYESRIFGHQGMKGVDDNK